MLQKQPHIAIYLRSLFDSGVGRIVVNLIQPCIDRNVKVDLVVHYANGPYIEQLPPQVRIIEFKTDRLLTGIPKLRQYLRQEKPTTLLSAGPLVTEIAIIAKYLAMVPTRVVISEHNTLSIDSRQGDPCGSKLKSSLLPFTARIFYPWADEIVAVSHGVAKDLADTADLPLKRIRVIYNPTITPQVKQKSLEPLDHPWFNPGEPPVILAVGRLAPQKDYPNLIRAFAKVRKRQSARLLIVGSGKEKSRLNQLVKELGLEKDIAMPGFVKNPYNYMKKAAVLVLSSAWEGLPTGLIEAMALGTPVVATNCLSGPEEILDHGKYGKLVPVGDENKMAEAILSVMSGNFQLVDSNWLEQFTQETAMEKYLDVLGISVQEE